jgi:citrate lyase subunit beta/citryl-CoA lyase
MRAPRSFLYVPGNRPDLLDKALAGSADALLVDLEDAVPVAGKADTRDAVARRLADLGTSGRPAVWVRCNPPPLLDADIRAIGERADLAGLALAKAEDPATVAGVDAHLRAVRGGALPLMPLLESAAAVLAAARLAAAPGVRVLQLGEADLCAETGIRPGTDDVELLAVRTSVLLVSTAAGIDPPLAPVSTEFRDLDAFRRSTEALARLGFHGRACIHPAQVDVANEVFTPSPEAVTHARDIVALLEVSDGVAVDADGRMVDEAVARQARRVLDRVVPADPQA